MANETIFDLVQDTALTAAHRFVSQATSAATRAKSATFGLMGGLIPNSQSPTTADITGAVGQFYLLTITGLTAARNLTLPSAQVGERLGVYIVDGHASNDIILKGAASQTINGGSAATEWSRVYTAGEVVIFRCTASNTWIVEVDGRIASTGAIYGAWTHTSSGSFVTADLASGTTSANVGDIIRVANDNWIARRAGKYALSADFDYAGGVEKSIIARLRVAAAQVGHDIYNITGAGSRIGTSASIVANCTQGQAVDFQAWQNDTASESINYDLNVTEIL